MKIIFLDIDGVLNSTDYIKRIPIQTVPNRNLYLNKCYGIDPDLIKNLKYILDKTNAKIVFSTSWRYLKDHPIVGNDWRKSLADLLHVDKSSTFIGDTPDINELGWEPSAWRRRGLEIKSWIDTNTEPGTFKYCVIDDEVVDIIGIIPESHVVHTDLRFGLTMKDSEKVISILNN